MEKLLSPAEVAELLGVPLGTVYKWNQQRTGPPVLHVGKHARYRAADVEAWLASRGAA